MPVTDGKFEFRPEDDGTLSLESAVFQALGAASMCWEPRPTGLFDSTRAKLIGDALVEMIRKQTVALVAYIHDDPGPDDATKPGDPPPAGMSDAQLLDWMGLDARRWAAAFCQKHPGVDEGTMLSWFANAIENGKRLISYRD